LQEESLFGRQGLGMVGVCIGDVCKTYGGVFGRGGWFGPKGEGGRGEEELERVVVGHG